MLLNILNLAIEKGASDVHVSEGKIPSLRINGKIYKLNEEPPVSRDAFTAGFKELLAGVNQEKVDDILLRVADYDFSVDSPGDSNVRFRVNFYRSLNGLNAVFRLIGNDIKNIDDWGFPGIFKTISQKTRGIVLICGPTGSGKSTTLSSIIEYINQNNEKHVITLENPIEFQYLDKKSIISQRQVGTHTKDFNSGLKSALREDPDVIVVGELRDIETVRLSLTAAETGHLVFATLHASNAKNAISRIVDVFPAEEKTFVQSMLSQSLVSIISQRFVTEGVEDGERLAVFEVLNNNTASASSIKDGKFNQLENIIQTSSDTDGMISFERSVEDYASKGKISPKKINAAKDQAIND